MEKLNIKKILSVLICVLLLVIMNPFLKTKAQTSSPLEIFTNSDASGEGYTYNKETHVLTLNNYNGNTIYVIGEKVDLITIELIGINNINYDYASYNDICGLELLYSTIIKGDGILNINHTSNSENDNIYGISANEKLTILSGTININISSKTYMTGISTSNGLEVKENANLKIDLTNTSEIENKKLTGISNNNGSILMNGSQNIKIFMHYDVIKNFTNNFAIYNSGNDINNCNIIINNCKIDIDAGNMYNSGICIDTRSLKGVIKIENSILNIKNVYTAIRNNSKLKDNMDQNDVIIKNSTLVIENASNGIISRYNGITIDNSSIDIKSQYESISAQGKSNTLGINITGTKPINLTNSVNINSSFAKILLDFDLGGSLNIKYSSPNETINYIKLGYNTILEKGVIISENSNGTKLYRNDSKDLTMKFVGVKAKAKLKGHSLTLNDGIGVNFALELDSIVKDTDYMKFTLENGEEQIITKAEAKLKDNLYYFTCPMVAKEMTDLIIAEFYLDNEVVFRDEYSIEEYAKIIMANEGNLYNLKTKELVRTMLNYGAAAQQYFNYKVETLANRSLTDTQKQVASKKDEFNLNVFNEFTPISNFTYKGSTLNLEDKTSIRHYFTVPETIDISKINIKWGNTETELKNIGKVFYKNNMLVCEINDLYSYELNKNLYCEIEYLGEKMLINYSAYTYANIVCTMDDKALLQKLMFAMADYCNQSNNYKLG